MSRVGNLQRWRDRDGGRQLLRHPSIVGRRQVAIVKMGVLDQVVAGGDRVGDRRRGDATDRDEAAEVVRRFDRCPQLGDGDGREVRHSTRIATA
jgi:hypothetical protein